MARFPTATPTRTVMWSNKPDKKQKWLCEKSYTPKNNFERTSISHRCYLLFKLQRKSNRTRFQSQENVRSSETALLKWNGFKSSIVSEFFQWKFKVYLWFTSFGCMNLGLVHSDSWLPWVYSEVPSRGSTQMTTWKKIKFEGLLYISRGESWNMFANTNVFICYTLKFCRAVQPKYFWITIGN